MQNGAIEAQPLTKPVIISEKCIGCKNCIKHCKGKMLAYDRSTNRMRVKEGRNCTLICRTCARLCPTGAVTFPDEEAFVTYLKVRLDEITHQLGPIEHPHASIPGNL